MKSTDERGFTLVEAIVAMVILTVGLVSVAQLMAVTLRMQQLGRNETAAVRVAQDKMDQLMSLGFGPNAANPAAVEDPRIAIGGSLTLDEDDHFDHFIADNYGYQRRWLVEAGPDGNPDLRIVTIRVTPDVADRRTVSPYELVSIIRRW